MAITNQERVGKALQLLNAGLGPFIERELATGRGDDEAAKEPRSGAGPHRRPARALGEDRRTRRSHHQVHHDGGRTAPRAKNRATQQNGKRLQRDGNASGKFRAGPEGRCCDQSCKHGHQGHGGGGQGVTICHGTPWDNGVAARIAGGVP